MANLHDNLKTNMAAIVNKAYWDLKQGRRRSLREDHKTMALISKNNRFARPARAFYILINFFAVLVLTTT